MPPSTAVKPEPIALLETASEFDKDIRTAVDARLQNASYPVIRSLRAECHNRIVRLYGKLPTFFLHQVAIHLVQNVPHVERVESCIDVA